MKNKLLYVDHDIYVSEIISELMQYENYDVIVDDGQSIFRILDENLIGLILMDDYLYPTKGSKLCSELKANRKTSDIPVIMISTHNNIAKIAGECGAVGYIKKPFDLDHVIDMVTPFLRKY